MSTTTMPKDLVRIRGLIRSLDALDHTPIPRNQIERSAADRDEARTLGAIIRETMANLDDLAIVCADYLVEKHPALLKEDRCGSYWGPDVFRYHESSNLYPDDSGQDPETQDYKSWAEINGLKAEEQAFEERACRRISELQANLRVNKKRAAAAKRATTRHRTEMFSRMLTTA